MEFECSVSRSVDRGCLPEFSVGKVWPLSSELPRLCTWLKKGETYIAAVSSHVFRHKVFCSVLNCFEGCDR